MHPKGEELVLCISGSMTLHQEIDGGVRTATLEAGQAATRWPSGRTHTSREGFSQ